MNTKLKAAFITLGVFLAFIIFALLLRYYPEFVFFASVITLIVIFGLIIYNDILTKLEEKKKNDKRD